MQTQRNFKLGMSLGQLLTGDLSDNNHLKLTDGLLDNNYLKLFMDTNNSYRNALKEKARIDSAAKQQELDNSSDLGLVKSLTAGIQNEGNDNVLNDALNYMKGSYKPREIMGVTQDGSSLGNMPKPSYLDRFPGLSQKYLGLKKMLASDDHDLGNLSKKYGKLTLERF